MVEDREPLDLLGPGEPLVDGVDVARERGAYAPIGSHRGDVSLDPQRRGEGGRPALVERQHRDRVRPAVTEDEGLRDPADPAQRRLEVGRRDVLAARGDDQVLLAAGDPQEPLRVE